MENWEVHHRGAVPLGAPALQHFGGGGIRAQGDPAAAARLLSHVGSAPEEVRHPAGAQRTCKQAWAPGSQTGAYSDLCWWRKPGCTKCATVLGCCGHKACLRGDQAVCLD